MSRFVSLSVWFMAAVVVPSINAEKANMSPEAMRNIATHVITGTVVQVFQRTETVGNWKYSRYVAEIRVEDLEKGDGIDEGGLLYARYWTRRWIGALSAPPSTSGHRGLPAEGTALRVYLARNAYDGFSRKNNDGGFNVIGANGFEVVSKDTSD